MRESFKNLLMRTVAILLLGVALPLGVFELGARAYYAVKPGELPSPTEIVSAGTGLSAGVGGGSLEEARWFRRRLQPRRQSGSPEGCLSL